MKRVAMLTGLLALTLAIPMTVAAQEKQQPPAAPSEPKRITSLKIDLVATEYDGARKVSSLPYSFYVNVDDPGRTQIRMGLRVPITTGQPVAAGSVVSTQFQYMDVGTNLDCKAFSTADSRYRLEISVDRSYLYTPSQNEQKSATGEGVSISSGNPIVARFGSNYNLYIKDGQTIEPTSTTDPISGRVLKVSVTANVVK